LASAIPTTKHNSKGRFKQVVGAQSGISAVMATQATKAQLAKEQQRLGVWQSVTDAKLLAKGFHQWKATRAGFVLKNSDFQVACQSQRIGAPVHCSAPMPQSVIDVLEAHAAQSKQKKQSFLQKDAVTRKATTDKKVESTAKRTEYTPLMKKFPMQAIKPELAYEHESDDASGVGSGTWSKKFNIDDAVDEGEQNNGDLNPEEETEVDIRMQHRFFDHIDVGPGNAIDEENERDTQHRPTYYKKSLRKNSHVAGDHANLIDVPFVDAGTDRVVNEHMFNFFKKHPQYHTSKSHWLTADRWKKWMILSGDEENVVGLSGGGMAGDIAGAEGGAGGSGGGMWRGCPENIPKKWPEVPRVTCKHFAVSPMGYWGCESLFEDGTCQKTKFFPTIRWDGLDAYPMPKPDPDAEPGEQHHNPKEYNNEILPGGNPVSHDDTFGYK
jgi:hypothetical protein